MSDYTLVLTPHLAFHLNYVSCFLSLFPELVPSNSYFMGISLTCCFPLQRKTRCYCRTTFGINIDHSSFIKHNQVVERIMYPNLPFF